MVRGEREEEEEEKERKRRRRGGGGGETKRELSDLETKSTRGKRTERDVVEQGTFELLFVLVAVAVAAVAVSGGASRSLPPPASELQYMSLGTGKEREERLILLSPDVSQSAEIQYKPHGGCGRAGEPKMADDSSPLSVTEV
ncbi:unnamed protein product [Pleuronectes platessa]|uniref:Uncharacterized protein n=1 Tax=Pleuronectes platessa TaxID=8262 RepID=A0A9N7V2Z1_PLEPL|nr:unnamed protein product [Pleuronectes platessa]